MQVIKEYGNEALGLFHGVEVIFRTSDQYIDTTKLYSKKILNRFLKQKEMMKGEYWMHQDLVVHLISSNDPDFAMKMSKIISKSPVEEVTDETKDELIKKYEDSKKDLLMIWSITNFEYSFSMNRVNPAREKKICEKMLKKGDVLLKTIRIPKLTNKEFNEILKNNEIERKYNLFNYGRPIESLFEVFEKL